MLVAAVIGASSFASLLMQGCGGGVHHDFLSDESAAEVDRRATAGICKKKPGRPRSDQWCNNRCDRLGALCHKNKAIIKNCVCTPPCVMDAVQFDFIKATIKENTMTDANTQNGNGKIVYGAIGTSNGRTLDLQVSVLNSYRTANNDYNGLYGKSGQINVLMGEEAKLEFKFLDADTGDTVELNAFYFSIFDIDRPIVGRGKEIIKVRGFKEIIFAENKEFMVEDIAPRFGGGKKITSTERGTVCDNPLDPENLVTVTCTTQGANPFTYQVDQAARSFIMLFEDTSTFEVTFEATPTETYGRNFQFSGWSSLVQPCVRCADWKRLNTANTHVSDEWCDANCVGAGNELHPACDANSGEHQFCGCRASDDQPQPECTSKRANIADSWCESNCLDHNKVLRNPLPAACDPKSGLHQVCTCEEPTDPVEYCGTDWTSFTTNIPSSWCDANCVGAGGELHPACDPASDYRHRVCHCDPAVPVDVCETEWKAVAGHPDNAWCNANCVGAGGELHPACDKETEVTHRFCACVEADECDSDAVGVSFTASQVSVNNLGGYGTEYDKDDVDTTGKLVIDKVAEVDGKDVSMVVRVCNAKNSADYQCSGDYVPYTPNAKRRGDNTNLDGDTIYINVEAGTTAYLRVSFESSDGTSVSMPAFYLTILDIDGPSKTQPEEVTLTGFSKLILPATQDYTVSEGTGVATITASEVGAGCDNPRNPAALEIVECKGRTVNQRARTFSALFEDTFTYELTLSAEKVKGSGGRNFALAGWSALVAPCPTPTPNPPPPSPPTPATCTCQPSNTYASEVCTDKDLFVWKGGLKTPHPVVGNWYTQDAEEFSSGSCMAYVTTNGGTCAEYCADIGLTCTRGMDDAHHQSNWLFGNDETRCSIYPGGHDRQVEADAGCNQRWKTQFCACGCADPSRLFLDECASTQDGEFKACNVAFSNPRDASDTTRDAVDLVFKATHCVKNAQTGVKECEKRPCVKFGADDGGDLLVSTTACEDDKLTITPSFELDDEHKTICFPNEFKFHVHIVHSTHGGVLEQTAPKEFEVGKGNYKIEILATPNLVTSSQTTCQN